MRLMPFAAFPKHCRAVAAIEFALTAPLVAIGLGGAVDYGIMEWSRSCLVNAVAQGAYYAYRTGPSVNTTTVQNLVINASSLTGVNFKRNIAAVASYCPTGTPAALGTSVKAGSTCTSDNSTAGEYLVISASYPVSSIISYSGIAGQSLTESVTVRLQ